MLSVNQIERLLEVAPGGIGAYRRLIERILSNGRCEAPEARRRLGEGGNARLAALGLALQRCCELTYGPTEIGERLARELGRSLADLEGQPSHPPGPPTPAAIAVAARGLLDWIARLEEVESEDAEIDSLREKTERCLARVGAAQDRSGLILGDESESAIVLWQLGEHRQDEAFVGRHLDLPRLRAAVMSATARADDAALCRFAYAVAA